MVQDAYGRCRRNAEETAIRRKEGGVKKEVSSVCNRWRKTVEDGGEDGDAVGLTDVRPAARVRC